MADLEWANEESAASKMASNRNKSGYFDTKMPRHYLDNEETCKEKLKHHSMRNLIPHKIMLIFF